jgi:hypothetical protein
MRIFTTERMCAVTELLCGHYSIQHSRSHQLAYFQEHGKQLKNASRHRDYCPLSSEEQQQLREQQAARRSFGWTIGDERELVIGELLEDARPAVMKGDEHRYDDHVDAAECDSITQEAEVEDGNSSSSSSSRKKWCRGCF